MFEKDAEEYAKKQFSSFVKGIREIARISFKKGAEFGYNKANEWHKDLPTEDVSFRRKIDKIFLVLIGFGILFLAYWSTI